jgi:ABC-2 type transport system permease protein
MSVRVWPTLLRIAFVEAIASRTAVLVGLLATTLPLITLALWTATTAPVPGRWSHGDFASYFLFVVIVRQLVSSWASWELTFEIRQGTLATRLLKPVHPITSYLAQNVAYLPLRALLLSPVVVAMSFVSGRTHVASPGGWGLFVVALLGAWVISFFSNLCVGALSFFFESTTKLMDAWFAALWLFSGALIPTAQAPEWLNTLSRWLPFRSVIALPAELGSGALTADEAWPQLAHQWAWALAFVGSAAWLWKAGVRRADSFGG